MRLTRIHVPGPLEPGREVELPKQAALHLTRVLRLPAGAALTLFNGEGGEFFATLEGRAGRQTMARVVAREDVDRESPLSITLLQGVARGERMDLIVQKSTELGVTRIIPVLTERSVIRLDAGQSARKTEHWRAIAIAACEQCGRNRVPRIDAATPLDVALAALDRDTLRCLLAADGSEPLAAAARAAGRRPISLLIGPEGGLAPTEQSAARGHGFTAYRMGPRILRTETAGLTALAVLQAIAGDFGQ